MKYLFALFLFTNLCLAQHQEVTDDQWKKSGASKIPLFENCEMAKKMARNDINAKTVFIFLQGGFASIKYSTDKTFEKQYNINFKDQGCVGSKCIKEYNQVVFNYLLKKFGENWSKQIRKDAIGFEEWKKEELNQQK